MTERKAFVEDSGIDPHRIRRKAIFEKYGNKVKELQTYNSFSSVIICLIVAGQLLIAKLMGDVSWPIVFIAAYFVGAFFSHALFVFIHECTHNLVAKSVFANKVMHIVCDIPVGFPSSHGFRKYHIAHHRHMGVMEQDADLPNEFEAKIIGNSRFLKALWLFLFMFVQLFRSVRIKSVRTWSLWLVANVIVTLGVNALVYQLWGVKSLLYLLFSTIFALGLHPLGGRWIQEHFLTNEKQETYSYYGILNKLTFNVGYHMEHHDFMNIPWTNLPKLKKLAPDFYDNMDYYPSWTMVVIDFIFNKNRSPYDRIIR